MTTLLLTIDTEFYISKEEILGISGRNGIDDILEILSSFDAKATFFFDYFTAHKWGEQLIAEVTEKIRSKGHEIELHLHPYIKGGKSFLWQYDKNEQRSFIKESIALYKKFNNNENPRFFRAGGYAANDDTLDILNEEGFVADFSYQYKQWRCKIGSDHLDGINSVGKYKSLTLFPTTVYKYYLPKGKYSSINFEWCSLSELKDISKQCIRADAEYFVVMMHSFALLNRWSRKRVTASAARKKRLKKFLQYCRDNNIKLQTVNDFFNSRTKEGKTAIKDFMPKVTNPFTLIKGALVKVMNSWILKQKFRKKLVIASILISFFTVILTYLIFFTYIEPSVIDTRETKLDLYSWNKDNDLSTIEYYYIYNPSRYKKLSKRKTDKDGIIYRMPFKDKRKYITPASMDTLYIPTDMSGAIITLFDQYQIFHKKSILDTIKIYAKWLNKNAVQKNEFAVWQYPFKFTKYNLDFNWTGAWCMGNVLSALSRYYQISYDSLTLQIIKKAVNSFTTPIDEGGIGYIDNKGNYWYEEYPEIPKSSVLNGHINGMFGLFDVWRVTKDSLAFSLFKKGLKTVKENLDRYDYGYWSRYDLKYDYVADYYYHVEVHIPQLEILYQLSGDKIFKSRAEKWKNYLNEPYFTLFKLHILKDAVSRRLKYKTIFSWGK